MSEEYIERGALLEILENQGHADIDDVLNIPAADVVEVKHGRWEDATWHNGWQTMTATCSNCHERGEVRVKRNECGEIVINSPCCPNCGAKMDGGADNG